MPPEIEAVVEAAVEQIEAAGAAASAEQSAEAAALAAAEAIALANVAAANAEQEAAATIVENEEDITWLRNRVTEQQAEIALLAAAGLSTAEAVARLEGRLPEQPSSPSIPEVSEETPEEIPEVSPEETHQDDPTLEADKREAEKETHKAPARKRPRNWL